MDRIETWTVAILAATALALFDLVSGWTVGNNLAPIAVGLGLVAVGIALFVAMVAAGIRNRRRIAAGTSDARTVLGEAARAMRWSGVFAAGFCVLLFSNCASVISPNPNVHVTSASLDVPAFLSLAGLLEGPLLLALLLPAALTATAQLLVRTRPNTALRLARLAPWASVLAAGVAFVTVPLGVVFGVSACDVGPSAGTCAAGASSLMNFSSIGSLALFLPYTGLVSWAVARMEYDRAHPS